MNARTTATAVAFTAVLAAGAVAVQLARADEPFASRLGTTPVIVELFTSQGCSSCPPADELMTRISHDESLKGKVIPVVFHVDYWDDGGWRDPFASHAWTQRQATYVQKLHAKDSYTPQAIVSGRKELVGSNGPALQSAIIEASHAQPGGTITLDAKRDGKSIVADVSGSGGPSNDIVVAVVEYDIPTNVGAGENKGRTIVNDAIVRSLQRVKPGHVKLNADPSWQHLAVVAFLQDRDTLAITNATVTRL